MVGKSDFSPMTLIRQLEKLPVVPPSMLVGRSSLFQDLSYRLTPEISQSVLLYGVEGIGKQAIAATLAASRLQALGEVLWLQVEPAYPDSITAQALRAYQLQAAEDGEKYLRQVLEQRHPLVIIQAGESPALALPFITNICQERIASLILTSRSFPQHQGNSIEIGSLDFAASQALWTHYAPHLKLPPATLENLQGHPLSIRLAALQVLQGTISLERLTLLLTPKPLTPLEIIQRLVSTLDKTLQGLLMAMSASFTNGISAELLSSLLGTPAQPLCQPLLDCGFITPHPAKGGVYYELPALVQRCGRDQLQHNGTFPAAQQRMLNGLAAFARRYATPKYDWMQNPLLLEMDNLLNAAAYSVEQNQIDSLAQVLHELSGLDIFVYNWGYQREYKQLKAKSGVQPSVPEMLSELDQLVLDPISAEDTAQLIAPLVATKKDTQPHPILDGEIVTPAAEEPPKHSIQPLLPPLPPPVLATALTTQLQNLQWALSEAEQRHNLPEVARLHRLLGDYYLEREELSAALTHLEQAVSFYEKQGDLMNVLYTLEVLAVQTLHYHGPEAALDYTKRGLNIARQLNDTPVRHRLMTVLGDIFSALQDGVNAIESYKRAVKLSRMMNDDLATGITLSKLAAVYMDSDHHREATVALNQAIGIFEQVGRRDLLGRSLGNLGTALGHLGRWHEAGQRHAAALQVARELSDSDEERFQLANLAYVAESEGHLQWAVNYLRQGLYLALLDEDQSAIAELTYELGRLLTQVPDQTAQALVLLEATQRYNPHLDLGRLIKETRARAKHRERTGMISEPVEVDLFAYASLAYPHQ